MFKQREIRQAVGALVDGTGRLESRVPTEAGHDAALQQAVDSALAVAGRPGPALPEQDRAATGNHAEGERAAERYGPEPAHAVRHLLTPPDASAHDRGTTSGRIAAALGQHGIRG
ncbi:hypothetical protein ACQKM2_15725 [Streptomyces sp. NPDC004126]|uniref:hypothetical protein n=1 Tax=Streptomyces sp. NPDC004126 TaxID=3390695 RepID=UPI003CFBDF75